MEASRLVKRLPVESDFFWSAIAARAVELMTPRVRADLAYGLETGIAVFRPTTLRDVAELIIRAAMPDVDSHCRAECVLAIIALDLVPAAGRAWRAALVKELEECNGR